MKKWLTYMKNKINDILLYFFPSFTDLQKVFAFFFLSIQFQLQKLFLQSLNIPLSLNKIRNLSNSRREQGSYLLIQLRGCTVLFGI